jgi:hypothetical protein
MEETKHSSPAHAAKLSEWPGGWGVFKPSREAVRRSLSTLILLALISIGGSLILSSLSHAFVPRHPAVGQLGPYFLLTLLFNLASGLFTAFVSASQIRTYVAGVRSSRVELGDATRAGSQLTWKLFLLNLLIGLTVLGGLILLIVPGIIFAVRLTLAPYFLVDKNLGVLDAFKAGWNATKGHMGKLWGIFGAAFVMALPIITIIGLPLSIYWLFMYGAANALLYVYLLDHGPAPDATGQSPAAPSQ